MPMRKKAFMAAIIVVLIGLAGVGLQVEVADANPINLPPMPPITLTVYSPKNGSTYYGGSVSYEFLTLIDSWDGAGELKQGVTVLLDGSVVGSFLELGAYRRGVLTELTNGLHCVEVRAVSSSYVPINSKTYQSTASSGKIYFTVTGSNVATFLEVKVVSVSLQAGGASFNFTTRQPANWLGYRLDQNDVVNITDEVLTSRWYGLYSYFVNITGLAAGNHNVTFYAEDEADIFGESNAFSFTVNNPPATATPESIPTPNLTSTPTLKPTLESTPTATPPNEDDQIGNFTLPIVFVVVVVAIAMAALAYSRRRKP